MPKRQLNDGTLSQTNDATLHPPKRRRQIARPQKRLQQPKHGDIEQEVAQLITEGVKASTRALKQAKGFERQRLGKRLRDASKVPAAESETLAHRINAEIAALKALDSRADIAQRHLYKTLLRIKTIRESEKLPPWVRPPATENHGENNEEEAKVISNVMSRLFRAKGVKGIVDGTLQAVQDALSATSGDATASTERTLDKRKPTNTTAPNTPSPSHVLDGGVSTAHVETAPLPEDIDESAFDPDEDDEFADFDDRIASSSATDDPDSDIDLDNASISSFPLTMPPNSARRAIYRPSSQSPSPSPSPSLASSTSREPHPVRAPRALVNNTSFLPTLSMGGYISNSDSEAEDLTEHIAPRKNRRGQRARQKIWEQKYGVKAKHVSKEGTDRNAGWDARHGAQVAGEKRMKGQPWKREKLADVGIASGPNEVKLGRRKAVKKEDDGKLHPSWEAKRLAKERAALSSKGFAGKKITFD